ncbi:MAG TPA: AMP-binding protein, partial [Ilumatobacteraceae bacterium]
MEMHFATIWESIADAIPEAPAVTHGSCTRTWAEYDQRAARLTSALADAGLGPDSKVGLYLYNSNEYLEAQFAAFKLRGVAINVNYRYLDDELWYLLDNSDAEALFFHASLGDRVARVIERLPKLKLLVEVDDGPAGQVDGAVPYEQLIGAHDAAPRVIRGEDDIYMLYTGGTTGMPKGVMYPMSGITQGFLTIGFPLVGQAVPASADAVAPAARAGHEAGAASISIPAAPLMHGTGLWIGACIPHLTGAHVVTLTSRSLDADEVMRTIEQHRATLLVIVGD